MGRRCENSLIVWDQTRSGSKFCSIRKRCTNHAQHRTPQWSFLIIRYFQEQRRRAHWTPAKVAKLQQVNKKSKCWYLICGICLQPLYLPRVRSFKCFSCQDPRGNQLSAKLTLRNRWFLECHHYHRVTALTTACSCCRRLSNLL